MSLKWIFSVLLPVIPAKQETGRWISNNRPTNICMLQICIYICTCLDSARNNSVLEILKDILRLSHTSLPSINAVYIFLVLKIHWSKVLYYAGCCALLLTFFLFFRNIKIAKIKFSSHWRQMMLFVLRGWKGKAIFKMSSC